MASFSANTQIHGYSLIKCLLLTLALVLGNAHVHAQAELSSSHKKAIKLYIKGQEKAKERDFESAIDFYSGAIKLDPNFYEPYVRKASLFNAMGMEDSVYSNFLNYLELAPNPSTAVMKRMSTLAFERGNYEGARKYLNRLIKTDGSLREDREIELLVKSIDFALDELKDPDNVEIISMPSEINRFKLQYLPSITIDNSTLVYTKRDQIEGDEDIVVSYFGDGSWSPAQSISLSINSRLNEGASTISADGNTMMFTSCDKRDSYGSCDIYYSRKSAKGWSRPKNLGKSINTHYWESQPSLSADGRTLYFSSNRPGGKGGRDIWVSALNENKKWSKPENLGGAVNTFKDETTPFIHPNGETLYFSSNGHIGMGGFDLLKSEKSDSTWNQPQNLGSPINSNNDEVGLLIAGNGETAYFAKEIQRGRVIIDSKIVKFNLPVRIKAKPASYITGRVLDAKTNLPLKARLEVVDIKENQTLFEISSDSITGNYTMVLPSAKELAYYVQKGGYLFFEDNFQSQPNSLVSPDTIDIFLRPIAQDEKLILRNIFFSIDSYDLTSKSLSEIEHVVQLLKENPGIDVEISGHTDNTGNQQYNQQLSENRAKAVYNELSRLGIENKRMTYKGFGSLIPHNTNETPEGRQSNRRIEFRVLRVRL